MRGFPPSTVSRHHNRRSDRAQLGDRTWNDWLEEAASEMHTADESAYPRDAGQALRVPQDIDRARMAAARDDDQPPVLHIADHGLVIPDPCIRLPSVVCARE